MADIAARIQDTTGAAIVLASRTREVDAWVAAHMKLGSCRASGRFSPAGFEKGRAAGRALDLQLLTKRPERARAWFESQAQQGAGRSPGEAALRRLDRAHG